MPTSLRGFTEWGEKAWIGLLETAPWRTYSKVVGAAAALRIPRPLRRSVLGALASVMKMDMSEAEHDVSQYDSLAELFTRRLKTEARPVDPTPQTIACPVDGCVSALGQVERGMLIQAKGVDYALSELVCDDALAERLEGGAFVTLYLRPRDYHRIHAPWDGRLVGLHRVGGTLFPVQPAFVRHLGGLFARNERVVTVYETAFGTCVLICVGAAAVGAISTPFDDANEAELRFDPPILVRKGDEVGAFNLGSTVILLFQAESVSLSSLGLEDEIRVGQTIADVTAGRVDG